MLIINMTIMCIVLAIFLSLSLTALRFIFPGANSEFVFLMICLIGAVLGALSMHYLKNNQSLETKLITPKDIMNFLKGIFADKK